MEGSPRCELPTPSKYSWIDRKHSLLTRISDLAMVPYGQYKSARLDFRGSDARNPATEGDTLWVNYSTRRFSSRSMAF